MRIAIIENGEIINALECERGEDIPLADGQTAKPWAEAVKRHALAAHLQPPAGGAAPPDPLALLTPTERRALSDMLLGLLAERGAITAPRLREIGGA